MKTTRLPAAARIGFAVFLCAATRLAAQHDASLTSPAAPAKPPTEAASAPDGVAPATAPELTEMKLVSQFDANGDGRLDAAERQAALAFLAKHPVVDVPTQTSGRPTPPPPRNTEFEPVKRGRPVAPDAVGRFPNEPLFGTAKIRTYFLTFNEADWENQLSEFARTDVQVPARLEVDGRVLDGVGVRFPLPRRSESFLPGYKRTLRLKLDYTEAGQQLAGHHRLELDAAPSDPSLVRTLLYHHVREDLLRGPAVSLVRVVINGEDWGVYTSTEPFDADFMREKFGDKVTMFWTAGPGANLAYLGDDPEAYRSRYRLESPEDPAAWARLIQLCKTLHQPVDDDTGHRLAAVIDSDSTLRFLALQNAFINQDGYGSATGSYGLYVGGDGRFRLVPLEAEHSFRLVQITEYTRPAHPGGAGSGRRHGSRKGGGGDASQTGPATDSAREEALLRPYLHRDFPKHSGMDLAALLSYSLIHKADADQDDTVTAEEWHAFAGSWYVIMDEDSTGSLSRDEFTAKVRLLVTPPSVIDGRTTQTFGHDDPAAMISGDFLKVIETDHDGRISREEMVAGFDRLFAQWTAGAKPTRLTQPILQEGLRAFLSQSVFMADQTFIPTAMPPPAPDGKKPAGGSGSRHGGGHGGAGGSGEGAGGNGLNIAGIPISIHKPGGGGHDSSPPEMTTFGEQLDPLEGKHDETLPLISRMFAIPKWQERYQIYLNQITEDWMLWTKLGPVAKQYHDAVAPLVKEETHTPFSYARFVQELDQETAGDPRDHEDNPSLKTFVTGRRSYLVKNSSGVGEN